MPDGREEQLLIRDDGDTLELTLNRPGKLNALTPDILTGLTGALSSVAPTKRCIIMRGAGRAFCSGHDLSQAAATPNVRLSLHDARELAESMQDVARMMRQCPVPIITAVHGYAIGGGAEIALSGDFVIVEAGTVFQFTEAAVGRVVTNGFTSLLPKTVGPVRAKALMLLGERFSAEDAVAWGLATRVASAGRLDEAIDGTVSQLHSRAPLAVSAMKRLLDASWDLDFETTLSMESTAAAESEVSDDAMEASQAFVEGREPVFIGK